MSRKVSSSAPSASYTRASSTGSPASRRPTKLTPLTTRPAVTSRQGMTRAVRTPLHRAEHGHRLGHPEAVLVQRLAHDDPGQVPPVELQPGQGVEILQG